MLLALFVAPAAAFCGTFVSVGDDAPTNVGSQVAVVRQGGFTTLTMANDVNGTAADFAMVIPVPEVLPEDAIHVVDPAIFAHVDAYSAPRLVAYDCDDFLEDDSDTALAAGGTDEEDSGEDTDTDTTVEAQYVVGEYEVVILSSTESGSLVSWLQTNGYNVPSESVTMLGEYIDAGAFFLAAQVRTDAGVQDGDTLSPLQLRYADSGGLLPIRLGTLNSPGVQDLTIFALSDSDEGSVAISNYAEGEVETDCMLPEGVSFGDHVDGVLDAALPTTGAAQWVEEYTWDNGNCDPCTPDGTLTEEDLASLGYAPDEHYGYNYTFTRLHVRYAPEQVTQDLLLYNTGLIEQTQLRYIEYGQELEDRFPVCGVGMVADPGSCDDVWGGDDGGDDDGDEAGDLLVGRGCGCDAGGGAGVAVGLLALGGALRRRR